MGVVYEARQISLNRSVALKMIRSAELATEDELRRFQNEAEAVALLDHSHIVPILEVGTHNGHRYFTMKLVSGAGLDRKLVDYVQSPSVAARLIRKAAEAVHHAHQRGILHRDLKPANILLDEQGEPFVTDFGLAKRFEVDANWTQTGAIMGTPAYMSPEQSSGKRGAMTTATDIYGLGAVLYALLTGHAPFGSDSMVETLEQVRERAPEPPRKQNHRVPRDLEVICLKCLEKDPARRYASAQALADDLRRFIDREPIPARPINAAARAWFWCKRKPAFAALMTSLAAAVALCITGIIWYWGESVRRGEAEAQGRQARAAVQMLTKIKDVGFDDRLDPHQKEFLTGALEYYKQLTSQIAQDPMIQLEHGRVYQQMGDIQRLLGQLSESERAYRKAIAMLESLAGRDGAGPIPSEHSPDPRRFSQIYLSAAVPTRARPNSCTKKPPPLRPSWPIPLMPHLRIACVSARP